MGLFKNKAVNQENVNYCIGVMYYNLDRTALVFNYHRIFSTSVITNIAKLINPAIFPGIEQFKYQINALKTLAVQVKELKTNSMINFDHAQNMREIDATLQNVIRNLDNFVQVYEESLCVDFEQDVISHEHREILYRLFGESMGIANALDAEADKLESEYHLLRNAFTSLIPDDKMMSFDNMFKAIMSLRYRINKK